MLAYLNRSHGSAYRESRSRARDLRMRAVVGKGFKGGGLGC